MQETRNNIANLIVDAVTESGFNKASFLEESIPWTVKVAEKLPGTTNRAFRDYSKIEAPDCLEDLELDFTEIVHGKIRELLESENLHHWIEEKSESKWWDHQAQVYPDETIETEKNGIKFVTKLEADPVCDILDFYDGYTPAAIYAYKNDEWCFLYVLTQAFDKDGNEIGEAGVGRVENSENHVKELVEELMEEIPNDIESTEVMPIPEIMYA